MPGELCPACGTDRTEAGCGCHPDVTETAVLPQIEGPPLVRPYVAQTDAPYDPAPLPIPAPPAHPPANRELGLFPLATLDAPAGRATARRSGRRRRSALLLGGAGAGVVALGIAMAFALAPSPAPHQDALNPAPSSAADLNATTAPSDLSPSPAAAGPTQKSAPPTSAAPHTKAATKLPVATTHAAAPPAAPVTAPAPVTTSAAPSPSPTPVQTLRLGYTGPELQPLQQRLIAAGCADSLSPGQYDWDTAQAVHNFQKQNRLSNEEWGAYTPATRAALTSGLTCGN